MDDWSADMLAGEMYYKKARADLVASQSCGPTARAIALQQAELHLLGAVDALRNALASVREQQRHKGSF